MQLALQSGGTGGDRVKRIAEDKEVSRTRTVAESNFSGLTNAWAASGLAAARLSSTVKPR